MGVSFMALLGADLLFYHTDGNSSTNKIEQDEDQSLADYYSLE